MSGAAPPATHVRDSKDHVYIVMLDGSVCWEPTDEDFETWKDEWRDLSGEEEWD